jgi:hypothetical protein
MSHGKKFLDPQRAQQPFGVGPWPCLNSASEHLGQRLITTVEVSITKRRRRRVPLGTFRCICGFAYSRVGPDRSDLDQYHIDDYVSFGEQWDKRVRELMSAGKAPDAIAASLDISRRTLRSQLVRLGLLRQLQATERSKAAKFNH